MKIRTCGTENANHGICSDVRSSPPGARVLPYRSHVPDFLYVFRFPLLASLVYKYKHPYPRAALVDVCHLTSSQPLTPRTTKYF